MAVERWTPTAFNLASGNPFAYDERALSDVSCTEVFTTGINMRDKRRCVVCGYTDAAALQHAHIVPKVDSERWEYMRARGFVPLPAKSVMHEARNGMLMCSNHHLQFDGLRFFIRWVPEFQRFVLINYSQEETLEEFHGHAVNLKPNHLRTPFHGAFLFHEMTVRGRWPTSIDRSIPLPIPWQSWIPNPDVNLSRAGPSQDEDDGEENNKEDDINTKNDPLLDSNSALSLTPQNLSDHQHSHHDPNAGGNFITLTDPFANPVELDALKRSFAMQPNWKAAVIEGESWEGSAEQNIAKYRRLVGVIE